MTWFLKYSRGSLTSSCAHVKADGDEVAGHEHTESYRRLRHKKVIDALMVRFWPRLPIEFVFSLPPREVTVHVTRARVDIPLAREELPAKVSRQRYGRRL